MNPIQSSAYKDQIIKALRNEIFSGNMNDGEELAQELVSAKLGVSRMPVREAFLQLENEGLLERLPNRHMRVVGLTPQRAHQYFEMLAQMECTAALLLLEQSPAEKLPSEVFELYQAALPLQGKAICDAREQQFHQSFSEALQNPILSRAHQKLLEGYCAYIKEHHLPEWRPLLQYNQAICQAFARKEADGLQSSIHVYYEFLAQTAAKEDQGE